MNYSKLTFLLLISLILQLNIFSQSGIEFDKSLNLKLIPVKFILGQNEYMISTKDSLFSININDENKASVAGFNIVIDSNNNSINFINKFGIIQNIDTEEYFYAASDDVIKDYVNCISLKSNSYCFRSFGHVDIYHKNGNGSYDNRQDNYIGEYEIKEGFVSNDIGYAISNVGLISFNLKDFKQVKILDKSPITSLDISENYIIYSTRDEIYFRHVSGEISKFRKINFHPKSKIIDIRVDEYGSLWVLCHDRVYCIYTIENLFKHNFKAQYDQKVFPQKLNGIPIKIELKDNKFHFITNLGDIYRYKYLPPKITKIQGKCFFLQGIKFPKKYAKKENVQVKIYKYNPSPKNSVKVCLLNEKENIYSYQSFSLSLE